MVELRTHLAIERAGMVILHLRLRAPYFYPDIRSYGSEGGAPGNRLLLVRLCAYLIREVQVLSRYTFSGL
jgi:hypothetical protein